MRGYFTTPISENIEETPEGFLIARDCVLARTGWQKYQVSDLPREAADRLGVDVSNPSASIELFRPLAEVFHPDTMKSAEGKPVTDNHPNSADGFVHPDNFAEFARGHIQHIRPGREQLDSGDYPLLGDIHITAEPLLSKVRNKTARELSLGYDYGIRRVGDRIEQCDFIINHCAVVPRARAGPEARINDAAAPEPSESPPPAPVIKEPAETTTLTKEKKPVKNKLLHTFGRGLRAMAADEATDPEDLAEAAMEISKHQEPPAQSSVVDAERKTAHDAFERMMDGKATDADMETLGKWMKEEKEEPEHQTDTAELEQVLASDAGEKCADCGAVMDKDHVCDAESEDPQEAEEEEEEGEEERSETGVADRVRATDAVEGARAVLKVLRPTVARCKDTAVHNAFNAALRSVTRSSRASAGSYDRFGTVARARDGAKRAPARARARAADAGAENPLEKLQKYYNDAHKGVK